MVRVGQTMSEVAEFGRRSKVSDRRLIVVEHGIQARRLLDQGNIGSEGSPVNIHINVGRDERVTKEKRPFSLLSSKLFWLVVSLSVAMGVAYGRTRMVCQSFKDAGRFYYGMDVDRCISVVRSNPLAPAASMLEQVNKSYLR